MELIAENIYKSLKGKTVLNNISLNLSSGIIYGFVGHNGAGKTMLFRALSGLIRLNSGQVFWNGQQLHKDFEVLPHLGIVLENAGLYPELSSSSNLELLAQINKIAKKADIHNAIARVGLDPDDKKPYKKYSLGMKQRLNIAQAIMEHPDIIMLDEPTNSLDESGISLVHRIIQEEAERGALILLASHNKETIHCLAKETYYMRDGCITDIEVENQ